MLVIVLLTIICIISLITIIYNLTLCDNKLYGGLGFIDGNTVFSDEIENNNERKIYYNNYKCKIPFLNYKLTSKIVKKQNTLDGMFKKKLKEQYDILTIPKRFYSECSNKGFLMFNLKNKFNNYELDFKYRLHDFQEKVTVYKNNNGYIFYRKDNRYIIPLTVTNKNIELSTKYNIPDGLIQLYSNNNYQTLFYELDENFSNYHWKKSIISDCLYVFVPNFKIPITINDYYLFVYENKVLLLIGNIIYDNENLIYKNIKLYSLSLNNLKYCIRHYCFNKQPETKEFNLKIPIYYENTIEYKRLDDSIFLKINNSGNIFYDLIISLIENHKL